MPAVAVDAIAAVVSWLHCRLHCCGSSMPLPSPLLLFCRRHCRSCCLAIVLAVLLSSLCSSYGVDIIIAVPKRALFRKRRSIIYVFYFLIMMVIVVFVVLVDSVVVFISFIDIVVLLLLLLLLGFPPFVNKIGAEITIF